MRVFILALRFFLELGTVLGIFSGVLLQSNLAEKSVFLLLGLGVSLLWARYGAPKSPRALKGLAKLGLELSVYSLGAGIFYYLFGSIIGTIYLILAFGDLLFMYRLGLQGN